MDLSKALSLNGEILRMRKLDNHAFKVIIKKEKKN